MASGKIDSNLFKKFVQTQGTSVTTCTIKGVGNYGVAICFLLVQGIGNSIFAVSVNGATTARSHIAGNQNATNAINITSSGNNSLTFSYQSPGFSLGLLCGLAGSLTIE